MLLFALYLCVGRCWTLEMRPSMCALWPPSPSLSEFSIMPCYMWSIHVIYSSVCQGRKIYRDLCVLFQFPDLGDHSTVMSKPDILSPYSRVIFIDVCYLCDECVSPRTVLTIGDYAFVIRYSLTTFIISEWVDNMCIIMYVWGYVWWIISCGRGVTSIGIGAFKNTDLTSVFIPRSESRTYILYLLLLLSVCSSVNATNVCPQDGADHWRFCLLRLLSDYRHHLRVSWQYCTL